MSKSIFNVRLAVLYVRGLRQRFFEAVDVMKIYLRGHLRGRNPLCLRGKTCLRRRTSYIISARKR